MTASTLTFHRVLDGETARLGDRVVGQILPFPGRAHRATWIVQLPDWQQCQGPSSAVEKARHKIEHEVREWLRSAGLAEAAERLVVCVEHNGARPAFAKASAGRA